jgi:hypothetical protein
MNSQKTYREIFTNSKNNKLFVGGYLANLIEPIIAIVSIGKIFEGTCQGPPVITMKYIDTLDLPKTNISDIYKFIYDNLQIGNVYINCE